jgi:hypothetical protein
MSNQALDLRTKTRASTEEVEITLKNLEGAFLEGRLDERELEERTAKAIKAKTIGDLDDLTHDLVIAPTTSVLKVPKSNHEILLKKNYMVAIFSGIEKKGTLFIPATMHITAIMGGCSLDLREARFESHTTHIYITAIMGGVEIKVGNNVRVQVQGMPIFGGISCKTESKKDLSSEAPTIIVHATAIFGGVEIKRLP